MGLKEWSRDPSTHERKKTPFAEKFRAQVERESREGTPHPRYGTDPKKVAARTILSPQWPLRSSDNATFASADANEKTSAVSNTLRMDPTWMVPGGAHAILLQKRHAQASRAHATAQREHTTEAARLVRDNALSIAHAKSEIAHESGTSDDHLDAAIAHSNAAEQLRLTGDALESDNRQFGENDPRLADVRALQADHEARAADHGGLAGHTSTWEHQGASEKPILHERNPEGGGNWRNRKETAERGHQALAAIAEHQSAAETHAKLRDSHLRESKSETPAGGGDWESKHPRDEQGRFTTV